MRTTLTIDEDVAAALEKLRKTQNRTLKGLINDVLREGLRALNAGSKKSRPFRTRSADLGGCLIGNVDNISEVLAVSESEGFR